eukprot:3825057-Rhodomonas_salina.6
MARHHDMTRDRAMSRMRSEIKFRQPQSWYRLYCGFGSLSLRLWVSFRSAGERSRLTVEEACPALGYNVHFV